VPGLDPVVATVARLTETGGLGDAPWIANRQPVQLLRIGPLAIVTVAGEPTTHAGRLLRATTMRALAGTGIERVVVCGYANAFSGYITTAVEYDNQGYEGGHTIYGPHTLAGWRTGCRRLARRFALPIEDRPKDRGQRPVVTPPEVLAQRRFPVLEPPG
jgi:neutral ceramidase